MNSEGEKFHSWNPSFGLELEELTINCFDVTFPSELVVSSGVSSEDSSRRFELSDDPNTQCRRREDQSATRLGSKTPPLCTERSFSYTKLHVDVKAALNMECKICGDRASGFHYGVYVCEGCKGFFRRTVRLNLKYKLCSRNCQIQKKSRNRCQFCRFRKCVLAGMSHSAIRFGRTPLAEREKMISEIHTLTHQLEPESKRRREIGRNLYESYLKHFPMTRSKARAILSGKDAENTVFVIYDMKSLTVGEEILRQKQSCVLVPFPGVELELSVFRRVTYGSADSVRRLTLFAKSIPGFMEMELSDQITMLKYSALEVNIIRLSHLTNQDGVLMSDGCVFMTREFLKSLRKPFCDMMEIKFDFLTKFRALELEDCDLALFITALILCDDRPGLLNPKAIEVLQNDVLQALELQLKVLHPDAPQLFAKLLQKMADLRPLVAEHVRNVHLLKQSELHLYLHPLLLEIMQDLY